MGIRGVVEEVVVEEEKKGKKVVEEEKEDGEGEREEVQEEKEADLEAAEDGFDWISDFFGEGFEDNPVREDDYNSTSAKDAGGEDCRAICTSATTTKVAEKANTSDGGAEAEAEAEEEGMVAEDPARERHKAAERERRKSMRDLFLSLHALLPHGNSVRKEQSAILDEVIGYIPLAASRLRTLKSTLYQRQANHELQTASAPPTSTDSTSGGSCRRISTQYSRYHPYSSSSCSSSSTDYAHINSAPIYSDCQSPLPPMQLPQEQDRRNMDDDRHVASIDVADYCINSSSSVSTSTTNNQPQLQLQIQPQQQQDEAPSSSSTVASNTSDPFAPSVSVRVRGDRLSVSVIDTREPYTSSSSCSSHGLLTLSMVLDELEAQNLRLIRSTHCRDGTKLIHYSESKIPEEMEGTPTELKAKLQHLAHKLQLMRSTGNP